MKFYGRAEQVAEKILEAFKTGGVAKAMAPVFIRRKDNVPCRSWSWGNQLVCILNGTLDARGIKQWNAVGRKVSKGSHSFDILAPLMKNVTLDDKATGERKVVSVLYGFKTVPVFAVESTEGEPLPSVDGEIEQWMNALPLVEVARSWGLKVEAFDGREHGPAGRYSRGHLIALGVKNLSTWAHELVHAADDRLGHLSERGQHWRSETVAELGGAILLEALGLESDSDRGGAWQYVSAYAKDANLTPLQACTEVLKRTCDAVNLLLAEAGKLSLIQAESSL
jgi:hypothetical protein